MHCAPRGAGAGSGCAGTAPKESYAPGHGTRLSINPQGYAMLPSSAGGAVPMDAGNYTLCFCHAHLRNDTTYSHCNSDCAFHTINNSMIFISMPRLGPSFDPGSGRSVTNVAANFRLRGGQTEMDSIKTTDHLYNSLDES